mgnify:CR=1 FL=1
MTLGDIMNQIKKYKKGVKNKKCDKFEKDNNNELKQLIILVIVITLILGAIYIVSTILKGKDYSSIFDNSLDVSEIQYDEVIIGNMLKQTENEYYVLILDNEDSYSGIFSNYIETYRSLEYDIKIYTVDLNNIFNISAKEEETNLDDLKFKSTILLKVKDGEIEESIEDSSEIGEKIIKLTKEIENKEEA